MAIDRIDLRRMRLGLPLCTLAPQMFGLLLDPFARGQARRLVPLVVVKFKLVRGWLDI